MPSNKAAATAALSLVASPAPATAASAPATGHHTVQKGDTLYGICRQYGVTPTELLEWNHKTDNGVKIGELLVVQAAK